MAEAAITLSETQERELRRRAGRYTRPHREVIRAKVVLLAAEGFSDAEIARRLDCTDKTAAKWRRRTTEPYASAQRVFWVVDNGTIHRGQKAIDRLQPPGRTSCSSTGRATRPG